VKVAVFADGIDVDNPDLIRPDRSHVIIDYKDFSGEGPNAASNSLEAFGDASSIAAQGNQVYDISNFTNPAHPLPAGCNIRVQGIAPGASLIAIKVFGNSDSAYNSVILQGLDYALTNDHPDVISESFGGYPIPDSTQDLTRQFNERAVADGVTVVESTGDSGVEAGPSSASSDPAVIAAGASTTFRNYAQLTQYGYQLSPNGWESDNISSIESAGFTQGGRVLDLVAPGEANWALCSANTTIYVGCTNFAGQPTNLQSFGGTSESTPLIAGGAALVIQAYRQTHNGQSPSPELVRELLTSTAIDLHAPSVEQGSGEMDTLAAVQAAESVGNRNQATGDGLLVSPTQLDLKGPAGSRFNAPVRVTNVGSSAQTISGTVRQLGTTLSNETGTVTLSDTSSPKFVDQFGVTVPYEKVTFTVPANADRLVTYLAWNDPTSRIGVTLFDPTGKMAAFTRPQGDGNHGEVDVADPQPGQWTGIIFRRDGTFNGPVNWQATSQSFGSAPDAVYPHSVTLAPGQSGWLHVVSSYPSSAGDSGQDLIVSSDAGTTSDVPIALRSLVPIGFDGGQFSGNLVGGNGRNGAFQPGQIDTYEFQVPRGEPELTVSMSTGSSPGTQVYGSLVSPSGQTVTDADNVYATTSVDSSGKLITTYHYTDGLEAFDANPQPGLWRWVVDVVNPVGGQVLSAPYTGQIGFAPPPIQVSGLPQGRHASLQAGQPATATVQVTNPGPGTEQFFLDPRTNDRQPYSLVSVTPDQGFTLPVPDTQNPPIYLMPTETDAVGAFVRATQPVTFDFGFGDPDLAAIHSGNLAAGYVLGQATPGLWDIAPDELGPFDGPAPAGTASAGMIALTRGFDTTATTSTGDPEDQAVNPTAAAFTPLILGPGQTGTMTVTFTPPASPGVGGGEQSDWFGHDRGHDRGYDRGQTVQGTLFVDVFENVFGISGETEAVPYSYRVATPQPSGGGGQGGSHGHHRGRGHGHG
ncbi:MAG: S8 family peptidase, partial [Trebonia sp.]